jgi:hypothetical protein
MVTVARKADVWQSEGAIAFVGPKGRITQALVSVLGKKNLVVPAVSLRSADVQTELSGIKVLFLPLPAHVLTKETAQKLKNVLGDNNVSLNVVVNGLTAFCHILPKLPGSDEQLCLFALGDQKCFADTLKSADHSVAGVIAAFPASIDKQGNVVAELPKDRPALLFQKLEASKQQEALIDWLTSVGIQSEIMSNYTLAVFKKLSINLINLFAAISGKNVSGVMSSYRQHFELAIAEMRQVALALTRYPYPPFSESDVEKLLNSKEILQACDKVDGNHRTSTGIDIDEVACGNRERIEFLCDPVVELAAYLGVKIPAIDLLNYYLHMVFNKAKEVSACKSEDKLEVFNQARAKILKEFESRWQETLSPQSIVQCVDRQKTAVNFLPVSAAISTAGAVVAAMQWPLAPVPLGLGFLLRAIACEVKIRGDFQANKLLEENKERSLHQVDTSDNLTEFNKQLFGAVDQSTSAQLVRAFRAARELMSCAALYVTTVKPSEKQFSILCVTLAATLSAVVLEEVYVAVINYSKNKQRYAHLNNQNLQLDGLYKQSLQQVMTHIEKRQILDKAIIGGQACMVATLITSMVTFFLQKKILFPISIGSLSASIFATLPLIKNAESRRNPLLKILDESVTKLESEKSIELESGDYSEKNVDQAKLFLGMALVHAEQKLGIKLNSLQRIELLVTVARLISGPFSSFYFLGGGDKRIAAFFSVVALWLISAVHPLIDWMKLKRVA